MVLSFLIISFLLLLLLLLIGSRRRHHNLPPGPRNLPIIGSLHRLTALPHRSLHALSKKYGPLIFLKLGTVPTVVASSSSTARSFLKTHDLLCCRRPVTVSMHRLTYGLNDIAFAPYGEKWRELRKVFSRKKVASFRGVREEEVGSMIGRIRSREGAVINLGEELVALASNISCRCAISKKFVREGEGKNVKAIITEAQEIAMGFFFADYFPIILGWLDYLTGMRARLEKNLRNLDKFYQDAIDDRDRKNEDRAEDVLDALLGIMKEGNHDITIEHIKGVLTDIFIAGSDTASATVEWAIAELMLNPESMRKVQHELWSLLNGNNVTESDLNNLPYLKCIVKETLRLHPVAPLLPRETIQHCIVDGYDIPAKTKLIINAFALGRDGSLWDRPEEFRPERFVGNEVDFRGHDFGFIPFGAGRRICPGMDFGLAVVELALANLLYAFEWELPEGVTDIDMSEASGIAVHKKYPLLLKAIKYTGM